MAYRVELSKGAAKEIAALQRPEQRKVVKSLEALAENPRPAGVEKLAENPAFWRICIGRSHRMIYTVHDQKKLVIIALVRNRSEAYRGLGNLDAAELIRNVEALRAQLRAQGPLQ